MSFKPKSHKLDESICKRLNITFRHGLRGRSSSAPRAKSKCPIRNPVKRIVYTEMQMAKGQCQEGPMPRLCCPPPYTQMPHWTPWGGLAPPSLSYIVLYFGEFWICQDLIPATKVPESGSLFPRKSFIPEFPLAHANFQFWESKQQGFVRTIEDNTQPPKQSATHTVEH